MQHCMDAIDQFGKQLCGRGCKHDKRLLISADIINVLASIKHILGINIADWDGTLSPHVLKCINDSLFEPAKNNIGGRAIMVMPDDVQGYTSKSKKAQGRDNKSLESVWIHINQKGRDHTYQIWHNVEKDKDKARVFK